MTLQLRIAFAATMISIFNISMAERCLAQEAPAHGRSSEFSTNADLIDRLRQRVEANRLTIAQLSNEIVTLRASLGRGSGSKITRLSQRSYPQLTTITAQRDHIARLQRELGTHHNLIKRLTARRDRLRAELVRRGQ